MGILRKIKKVRFSLWILTVFGFVGVFADFLANERPIYIKVDGKSYFPVAHQYLELMGVGTYPFLKQKSWAEHNHNKQLMPLIPFSPTTIFSFEQNYKHPGSNVKVQNKYYRHFLGTDAIGRDVASAMIHGTRLALMVGFVAAFIAFFVGTVLGLMAGYFGDHGFEISLAALLGFIVINCLAIFYLFYSANQWPLIFLVGLLVNLSWYIFCSKLNITNYLSSRIRVPVDLLINRIIEVFNSIPNLLVLLTLLSLLKSSSILTIMWIIGFLSWPAVARIVRAEVLKIRSKEFILASKMLNLSDIKIMYKQILPNIWSPIIVAFAFSVSAAILAEATISFLGIGVNPSHVSWGSLLGSARSNFSAWWLAVFFQAWLFFYWCFLLMI